MKLTIEECKQVQYCEYRYQAKVDLAENAFRLFRVEDMLLLFLQGVNVRRSFKDYPQVPTLFSCVPRTRSC